MENNPQPNIDLQTLRALLLNKVAYAFDGEISPEAGEVYFRENPQGLNQEELSCKSAKFASEALAAVTAHMCSLNTK